jgi:hypothetical protein
LTTVVRLAGQRATVAGEELAHAQASSCAARGHGLALALCGFDYLLADKGEDLQARAASTPGAWTPWPPRCATWVAKDRSDAHRGLPPDLVAAGQTSIDPLVRGAPRGAGGPEKVDEVLEAGGRSCTAAWWPWAPSVWPWSKRLRIPHRRTGRETGFTLLDIRPESVVLQGRNPQTGVLENVVVPIEEDIIKFVEEGDAKQ